MPYLVSAQQRLGHVGSEVDMSACPICKVIYMRAAGKVGEGREVEGGGGIVEGT